MLSNSEIKHRFGFHKAAIEGENATAPVHAALRAEFTSFAKALEETVPDGREKALMFTALEESSMWAHKAVASRDPLVEE